MNAHEARLARRGDLEALQRLADRREKAKRWAKGRRKVARREKPARDHGIRDRVFARANGVCEWCPKRPPQEWNHILSGGVRRLLESDETTAAICGECHRGWHRGDLEVLDDAGRWALKHGFKVALWAIDRRRDKVLEARRRTNT